MDNTFITNLLIELLSEYNRVSLPCLGSFMGQYKPAYFSVEKGVMYPPSKQVEFHQNEIWNDERLEKLIAERQDISLGKAKEKLAFWIDNVCVELSMGETVILPNLGELVVSFGNRLKFIQYDNGNLLLDSFGLEAIPLDAEAKVYAVSPTSVNLPVEPVNPPKNKYLWLLVSLLLILVLVLVLGLLTHFRVIAVPDSVIEKYPWVNNYLRNQEVKEEALFPAIDAAYDESESNIPIVSPEITDTTSYNSLQNTVADTLDTAATDTSKVNNVKPQPLAHYHIIVKSAKNYDDARRIAKEWAKKDYVVQILYTEGSEPYKISIEFYLNEEEAGKKLEELKQNDEELNNAFVMEYSNESKL